MIAYVLQERHTLFDWEKDLIRFIGISHVGMGNKLPLFDVWQRYVFAILIADSMAVA